MCSVSGAIPRAGGTGMSKALSWPCRSSGLVYTGWTRVSCEAPVQLVIDRVRI